MIFKEWLMKKKLENNLTLEELADKLKLGTTIVNLYLKGLKIPHYASRWKIHEAFDVEYEEINKMIEEQLRGK